MLGILGIGKTILDKIVPDKVQRDELTLKLMQLEQEGAFKPEELRYNAITAEAQSEDKWTSRARPTFLYVMYIIILSSIPFGFLQCIDPVAAAAFSLGFKEWLAAVPPILWESMTAGFLGYCASRTVEKTKNHAK